MTRSRRQEEGKRDATYQGLKGKLAGYRSEVASVAAENVADPERSASVAPACLFGSGEPADPRASMARPASPWVWNSSCRNDELTSRFAAIAGLSRRECEVCARIRYGMSMKEIARDLGITAETGTTYRKRAYLHLRVGNRSDLLRRLLENLGL